MSPVFSLPTSPSVSSTHSSAMLCYLSDYHIHMIQQSKDITSVSQVSEGNKWKPIGLHYFNNILSTFLVAYHKEYITQHVLIKAIEYIPK